jgi:biopolymer transport protein ExbB
MSFVSLLTAAPAAAGAVAKKSFGPVESIVEGGPVSWTLTAILVIMSMGTIYILLTKYLEQGKVMKQYNDVRANFWRAGSLQEGAAKLEKNSAYRQIVDDGVNAQQQHGLLTDPVEAHDWLHGAMTRSEESINNKLNSGLSFLATVGSTSPFVGLLGTVIGILNALIKIGIAGQASLDAVAGPVGEALYMTALGLIVAVPAVIAYNWLQGRNKTIARNLSAFSNDVLGYISSNGKLKPAVSTAAARPAAATAAPVKK